MAPRLAPAIVRLTPLEARIAVALEDFSAAGRLVVTQNGTEIRARYTHDGHVGPSSPIREVSQLDPVARRVDVEDRGEAGVRTDEKEAAVLRTAEASGDDLRRAILGSKSKRCLGYQSFEHLSSCVVRTRRKR